MAKPSSTQYLSDESSESIEANRKYQEALTKLTESLDTRKNRFFAMLQKSRMKIKDWMSHLGKRN